MVGRLDDHPDAHGLQHVLDRVGDLSGQTLLDPSKPGDMRTSNQVATLAEAKAEFEVSWKQWKAWVGMEERA